MIFEIKKYKLNLAGREEPITLSMDFNAIYKLSKFYGNAYTIIGLFLSGDVDTIPKLIRCCAEEELTEEEIIKGLPLNYNTMNSISQMFDDLIQEEIIGETKEEVTEKN